MSRVLAVGTKGVAAEFMAEPAASTRTAGMQEAGQGGPLPFEG